MVHIFTDRLEFYEAHLAYRFIHALHINADVQLMEREVRLSISLDKVSVVDPAPIYL